MKQFSFNLKEDIPNQIFNLLKDIQYDNFTDEELYIIKTPGTSF